MIDQEPTLSHHLFEIAITERMTQIPPHTEKNDVGLEMTWLWMDGNDVMLR